MRCFQSLPGVLLVVATAAHVPYAAPLPLGHPDFKPSPERPVGWRGDGTGIFPGAQPVIKWSDGTKIGQGKNAKGQMEKQLRRDLKAPSKNILWRTMLPCWANASPVVVRNRVFVTADPVDIAPLLICIDATTGDILWQREIDHTEELPEKVRAKVRKEWSDFFNLARTLARLHAEQSAIDRALKENPADTKAQARRNDWAISAAAVNATKLKFTKWGCVDAPGILSDQQLNRLKQLDQKYGCYFPKWEIGISKNHLQIGAYVGYSHPTPVSDGKNVYVWTGYNTAACYDLEGNLKWLRWFGPFKRVSYAGWIEFTQSPVLLDGKLLVANKVWLRALDPATGRTLWERQATEAHAKKVSGYNCLLFTGLPIRIGNETFFFWFDGRLYRVSDGLAVTGRVPGDDSFFVSWCPIACRDTLVYCAKAPGHGKKSSLVAVRFEKKDAKTVGHKLLWRKPIEGEPRNGFCLDGKAYIPTSKRGRGAERPESKYKDKVWDLETGEAVGEMDFVGDHLTGIVKAGDHIISLESVRSGQGRFTVHDMTGKILAINLLSSAPAKGERLELIRGITGRDGWHDGHYHGSFHAVPFFVKDRIYVRSRDELICIGDPALHDKSKGGGKKLNTADQVLKWLGSKHRWDRDTAIRKVVALAPAEKKKALPGLVQGLAKGEPPAREAHAQALAALGNDAAGVVGDMVKAVEVALGKGDVKGVGPVMAALREVSPGSELKLLPAIREGLAGGNTDIVRAACKACGYVGAKGAELVPALSKALAHANKDVVLDAIGAAAGIGPAAAAATPALARCLARSEEAVVTRALNALQKVGPGAKAAAPAAGKLLSHKSPLMAARAAKFLEVLGQGAAPAVPQLVKALSRPELPASNGAADVLFGMGPNMQGKLSDSLMGLVTHSNPEVAANSARILARLGPKLKNKQHRTRAIIGLTEALKKVPKGTKGSIALALGAFGKEAKGSIRALKNEALSLDCQKQAKAALKMIDPEINVNKIQPEIGVGDDDDDDLDLDL